MHLTPREFDKLLIYMVAEVALKRKGPVVPVGTGARGACRRRSAR